MASKNILCVVVFIACAANQGLSQDQPAACAETVSSGIIAGTSSVFVDATLEDPVPLCIRCGVLVGLSIQLFTNTSNVEYQDSNGVALVNNTNGIIITEYGLLINDLASTFTNGESIVCAFNDGSNYLEYQIAFDILIFNPPPITPNISVLNIVEGVEDVSLTCTGDSNIDTDRYQWLLPDGTVFPEYTTVADSGLVLELKSITRAKSGVYVCFGILFGTSTTRESNITVNVQYPAKVLSLSPGYSTTLTLGSTLSLNCTFEGNPTPSVSWSHNGTALATISTSDPNYSETIIPGHYALLDITFATIYVSGDYACGVSNSLGEDQTKNTSIIVQVAPGPVYSLMNTSSTQTCVSLAWMFGFNGNSPITGVDISYEASNLAHGGFISTNTNEQTTITICDLQPSTTYEFTVKVRNEVSDTVGVSSSQIVSAATLMISRLPTDNDGQFMVRLVDGINSCIGRLEIKPADSSVYGQACGLDAGNNEAMVICKQLGCTTRGAERVDVRRLNISISASTVYSAFNYTCNRGNERNITDCERTDSTCVEGNTDYVIAIICASADGAKPLTVVLVLMVAVVSLLLITTNMDVITVTSL